MKGIYQIKNIINNKIYIGSSANIEKRWEAHINLLNRGVHHSIHLQNAWNKYGSENFKFIIVEQVINDELLLIRENYYLEILLKSNEYINGISSYFIENGYNICPLAIKGFTGKHTKKTLIKMLKNKGQYKEILKIDINNNILFTYDFISDIEESYNAVMYSINNNVCIKGKNYGYVLLNNWSKNYKIKQQIIWNKGLKKPTNIGIKVYVYDIYGCFFKKFDTLKQCADFFNTNTASIHRRMNNNKIKFSLKTELSKYLFSYNKLNINTKIKFSNKGNIKVYDIFNNYLCNSNLKEITDLLNVSKNSIYSCLNGRRKQLKGYIFQKES